MFTNPENFSACVQYNDRKGTSAADDADKNDATNWLKKNSRISENEHLVGIEMLAGENHGKHGDPINVNFLLLELGEGQNIQSVIDSTTGPVEVRCENVEMTVKEFFGLFKRFNVPLSRNKILEGREYHYYD